MRFLRTASTTRLLAILAAAVVIVAGGTAIAVAAGGSGPVPARQPLANAIHQALAAPASKGITADVSFTNNLIDSSDFTGDAKDPILQGATGRLWLAKNRLRLELQSDNGDAQVLVNGNSFWVSDPTSNTLYKGTLPADTKSTKSTKSTSGASGSQDAVPTIAQIQKQLNGLAKQLDLSGAQPTDVAGRAAYRVVVSPKHDGGLLGSARLAWDALAGTPLEVGIYARGNSTPVLDLKATNISYGAVPASNFDVSPPAGEKVVNLSARGHSAPHGGAEGKGKGKSHDVTGVGPVAKAVPFTLHAPATLVGLPRHDVSLMNSGGKPGALVTYGQGAGGVAVIEQAPDKGAGAGAGSTSRDGLSLPTVSIDGATGHELSTALGTGLQVTTGGVAYTVIGSVPAAAAEQAARALARS